MEDKHCTASPLDITYCMNAGCPITQCERHLTKLRALQKKISGMEDGQGGRSQRDMQGLYQVPFGGEDMSIEKTASYPSPTEGGLTMKKQIELCKVRPGEIFELGGEAPDGNK